MKVQSSENKLVITEEFIFDQNKLPSDPNNHFKVHLHLSFVKQLNIITEGFIKSVVLKMESL